MQERSGASVRICLLGRFAVTVDEAAVEERWRLRKARILVKILAVTPGHRAHRGVLIEQLWPDGSTLTAANNFHQLLHATRRVLGTSRIALTDDLVVLGPDGDVVVDVDEFVHAAEAALSTGKVDDLIDALGRWTGELLPADLYDDWIATRRVWLDGLRVAVTVRTAGALVELGDGDRAVALLEPLIAATFADYQRRSAELPVQAELHIHHLGGAMARVPTPPSRCARESKHGRAVRSGAGTATSAM